MVEPSQKLAPIEKVIPALIHHFATPSPGAAVLEKPTLIALLRKLPSLSTAVHIDTIAVQLLRHEPAASYGIEDFAVISFIDEAITEIVSQTDLDFKIESYIRGLAPLIAASAFESDVNQATEQNPLYDLIDLLMTECIGWSEDLGILGQQYIEKIDIAMAGISSGRSSVVQSIKAIKSHIQRESPAFHKLEQRLCKKELKVLSGKKAHYFSSELLNKEMTGQKLPLFIIFMLQGPWFEFLQQVYIEYGDTSKEWQNVRKMTEAVIWALQADRAPVKQRSIMTTVPNHIRSLCDRSGFDTQGVTASLADLEDEFEAIKAGEPSEACDFELLGIDESTAAMMLTNSADAVEQIKAMPLGGWFFVR